MTFASYGCILFIAACAAVYYIVPGRFQNPFLVAASFAFYAFSMPQYAGLLLASAAAGYFAARLIEASADEKKRSLLLTLSVAANVALLFVFKYYNFFTETLFDISGGEISAGRLSLVLPLGISFYTLQIIGYLVDVRRGSIHSERNFVDFVLFVSFFPQILSGPIGRAGELLPQYKQRRVFEYETVTDGASRFFLGLFKKVVIADGIGLLVDTVYGNLSFYSAPLTAFLTLVAYNFQIYFDFSGYCDMAVGTARIFGIKLRENFAAPYFSKNFSEFWTRWHISLSSWLQDYVFIPLVWSRWWNRLFHKKEWNDRAPHVLANLMIVFFISGLWHGASYNFVIWGLLNGAFRVTEELIHRVRKRPKKLASTALNTARHIGKASVVFLLFGFAHIYFRALDTEEAALFIKNLFGLGQGGDAAVNLMTLMYSAYPGGELYTKLHIALLAAAFVLACVFDYMVFKAPAGDPLRANPLLRLPGSVRLSCCVFMLLSVFLIGQFGSSSFIYFRF